MGLGHFLDSASKAVGNVEHAVDFAVSHPGKTLQTVGKVGSYALQHPGEVGKIALHEGIKSLTDPKELMINAALIAATGGAGIIAKEATEVGAKAAVETGAKVVGDVAEKTTAKVAEETAGKVAADAATKTTAKAGAEAGGRSLEQKILETGTHNPISQRITQFRTGAAQSFLNAGGEAPSALRQAGAAVIQGTSGTAPTQLEGMSDLGYKAQKMAWRGQQIQKRVGQVKTAGNVTEAAAHPEQAAMKALTSGKGHGNQAPVSQQSGTEIEPYKQPGAVEPVRQPGSMQPLSQPVNNAYTPGRGFSTPASGGTGGLPPTTPPAAGGSASSPYPGMPGSPNSASSASTSSSTASPSQSRAYRAGRGFATKTPGLAKQAGKAGNWLNSPALVTPPGQRFWQGPHREMFGGIEPDYDWRKGYENRAMTRKPKLRQLGMNDAETAKKPGETEKGGTPGAYDTPSGQQPEGALNPGAPKMTELGAWNPGELGSGPNVNFGGPGPFKKGAPLAVGQGGRKASFYAASGEYTPQKSNTGIIDADSHSPDDYKFEPGGQGYLDFPDMPRGPLSQPKSKKLVPMGQQQLGI